MNIAYLHLVPHGTFRLQAVIPVIRFFWKIASVLEFLKQAFFQTIAHHRVAVCVDDVFTCLCGLLLCDNQRCQLNADLTSCLNNLVGRV